MTSVTLKLTKELVKRESITPRDAGCQKLISDRLQSLGFKATSLKYGDVDNLWLRKGIESPLLVFAGHTDVVPPGPLEDWNTGPFEPTILGDYLFGRGTADMKSSIAAFVVAVERHLKSHTDPKGSIGFLLTSDEEGPAINGTKKVVEWLKKRKETPDFCIVGEPTSSEYLGDTIKNGRRGSLSANLTIFGKQGHVAYPHLANNAVHLVAPFISQLNLINWDCGNELFPPTTLQISNLNAGTGANNVIPGKVKMSFNLRFSPAITPDDIKKTVEKLLKKHKLKYEIEWNVSGTPHYTKPSPFVKLVQNAILDVTGISPMLSTSGGVSDARFIKTICDQVIEFGPINKTIHQVNEQILTKDLDQLTDIYQKILDDLLHHDRSQ